MIVTIIIVIVIKPNKLKIKEDANDILNCKFFVNCKVCTDKCRIFQPISCKDRDRNIGVCNNCPKLKNVQSLNHLTQEKINLMFSHINSTPRENLGGKTPYEIFSFIYGENLALKLDMQRIAKDEVNTTPRLLK